MLTAGTRLGVYEVVDSLGAGGMGEVYRATDTKLGRAVAVKILPDAVAADADRVSRFEREARVLASLNHPHIAALYGMEQADPSPGSGQAARLFLVMELVEGETLGDRLQRGPMPLDDVLRVALQIAEALEAAHERGIVHRDLKPANVKITPDDNVKVLDFGLAKLAPGGAGEAGGPGAGNLTRSPTLSLMATQAGMILGTAAYMSPEQAKGFPADQRSDVFSFGVVLYEMLTGRQPFQGETAPEILASVLVREADLGRLPANLNPRLIDLVKRCLEKTPKRRWQAIGDLRAELETISANPLALASPAPSAAPPRPLWKRAIPVLLTAIVVFALTAGSMWRARPAAPAPVARFSIALGQGQQVATTSRSLLAISPDGSQIVYLADRVKLYLRSLSEVDARPISGNEATPGGPVNGFAISPDGRWVAYWAAGERALKKIATSGGAAVTICPLEIAPFGMSWDANDILFGLPNKGILRVSASGGSPEVIAAVKGDEIAYGPQILPGGEHVLFTLTTSVSSESRDKSAIVVESLKSSERKTLFVGGSDGRYVPTGHLVYAVGGVLFAVPFDLGRLSVTGGPIPIVEGVRRAAGTVPGIAHFSFSKTGSLVFFPGPAAGAAGGRDFVLADRTGAVESLKVPTAAYQSPRISPDDRRVAYGVDDASDASVWIYDLAATTSRRRLTFGGKDRYPIWSADGQRVTFQSDREGAPGIFWQRADGGTAERLTKAEPGTAHIPESWSPNGEHLLFSIRKNSKFVLWTLSPRDAKLTPFDTFETAYPTSAVFSPDGRWVAYGASIDAGRPGASIVYVQPFPATGTKYEISKSDEDGHHPVWSPDGKELSYIPQAGQFVRVSVTTQPSFSFGDPVPIPRAFNFGNSPADVRSHDITRDGKRFLGLTFAGGQPQTDAGRSPQIQVVLNWFEELRQRVEAK